MVKGGNANNDVAPMLSQSPSQQQQQQQGVSAVSPLLNVSPHSSQLNLFSSYNASTADSQYSAGNRHVVGSGATGMMLASADGEGSAGAESSTSNSAAFLHNMPFRFSASASGAMMPPYTRAELYSIEPMDMDSSGNVGSGGGRYEEESHNNHNGHSPTEAQRGRRPSFTHYYPSQQQQQYRRAHTPEKQHGDYGSNLTAQDLSEDAAGGGSEMHIYTPLSSYGGAPLPSSLSAARDPAALAQLPTAEFIPTPTHSPPHDSLSLDSQAPVPQRAQRTRGTEENDLEGENDQVDSVDSAHVGSAPSALLSTQPPHSPPATQEQQNTTTVLSTPATAAERVSGCAFTAEELTATLEAAVQRAVSGGRHGAAAHSEVWCPAGSQFSVYDAGMKAHYLIPSEKVALTRGAVKYVTLFERYGNQTRFRFQVCNRYLNNRCTCGLECQYIHSHVLSKSTQVHMNENSITATGVRRMDAAELAGGKNTLGYPTMDSGMVFAVYPPNQLNSAPQYIPSELILVTEGALQTFRALGGETESMRTALSSDDSSKQPSQQQQLQDQQDQHHSITAGGNIDVPIVRPRHCAHFQFKRMCNLGATCHFIHSLIPFVQGMVNQPPLSFPFNPAALDERSAGFVVAKLSGETQSVASTQPSHPNTGNDSNNTSVNHNASPAMANASATPSQQQQQWTQPTVYQAEPSLLAMGDAPAPMNAMSAIFAAHYPPNVAAKMVMPTTASAAAAAAAMYGAEAAAAAGFAAWGTTFGAGCGGGYAMPHVSPMAAMTPFAVPAALPPPAMPQQPAFIQSSVSGFPNPSAAAAAQLSPQAYAAYANSSLQPQPAVPQPSWPPTGTPFL